MLMLPDKLHATRLLGIEERPFKRLTKRLLASNTPIQTFLSRPNEQLSSDSTIAGEAPSAPDFDQQKFLKDLQRFREDANLDFAAFESSIARIQFLRAANEKERERYAAEKHKIEQTAQEVRDNTAQLRVQLDEAQKTLAIRKTYDVLADQITRNTALKPRDEQHVNIEKLKAEIEELERESQEHHQAWVDRREQFGRIVGESARLRRLVRDEKEPDEKDGQEGEQEDGDGDDEMLGIDRDHDPTSNVGSPRPPDDASTPMPVPHESGVLTPRSTLADGGAATPQADVVKDNEGLPDAEMTDEQSQDLKQPQQPPSVQVEAVKDKIGDEMDTT